MIQESNPMPSGEPSGSCGQSISGHGRHIRGPRNALLRVNSIFIAALVSLGLVLIMVQDAKAESSNQVVIAHVTRDFQLDAAYPAAEWKDARPIVFSANWQGQNPDPTRQTTVQALWSNTTLYLHFECHYRDITVFADSDSDGRRDHLWDRDVVEAFLQPEPSSERLYKEFEVAPNSMWIDLDISPNGRADLQSGLKRSVYLDRQAQTWTAELAIPLAAITKRFDPAHDWHVNFYRVEGAKEPRNYLAWQPTNTPEPNFHVPAVFGIMKFALPSKK
jgi:hypothetical protein